MANQTPPTLRAAIEAIRDEHLDHYSMINAALLKEMLTAALAQPDGEVDREALAALQHEQWSGWMIYLFSRCTSVEGGQLIPREWVERWTRQMGLPYAELTDAEKDSDRAEADRVIALFKATPADTPPPSPQPSLTREEWRYITFVLDKRAERLPGAIVGANGCEITELAAKCRAHAEPETGR